MKKITAAIAIRLSLGLILTLGCGSRAQANDAEMRARAYNEILRAPARGTLDRAVGRPFDGIRNVKTVLSGVLYRGGGPGGRVQLNESGLRSLCEAGFARAYYLYPQGFTGERSLSCTGPDGKPNTLQYVQKGYYSAEEKANILADVHQRILDPEARPVFVHCWNGLHASGEIAAVALVQFCGSSIDQAEAYWMRNQRGARLITRIRKFEELPNLRIPSHIESAVCPRD